MWSFDGWVALLTVLWKSDPLLKAEVGTFLRKLFCLLLFLCQKFFGFSISRTGWNGFSLYLLYKSCQPFWFETWIKIDLFCSANFLLLFPVSSWRFYALLQFKMYHSASMRKKALTYSSILWQSLAMLLFKIKFPRMLCIFWIPTDHIGTVQGANKCRISVVFLWINIFVVIQIAVNSSTLQQDFVADANKCK